MFGLRVFYAGKIVAEDCVKARSYTHACSLAEYCARTLARESIPPWMFDARRVTWLVLEPVLQIV